jgi:hypothetical protein
MSFPWTYIEDDEDNNSSFTIGIGILNTMTDDIVVNSDIEINANDSNNGSINANMFDANAASSQDLSNEVSLMAISTILTEESTIDSTEPGNVTSIITPSLDIAPAAPSTTPMPVAQANEDAPPSTIIADDVSSVTTASTTGYPVEIPNARHPCHPTHNISSATYDMSVGDYMQQILQNSQAVPPTPFLAFNPFEAAPTIFANNAEATSLCRSFAVHQNNIAYATPKDIENLGKSFAYLRERLADAITNVADLSQHREEDEEWYVPTTRDLMLPSTIQTRVGVGLHLAYSKTQNHEVQSIMNKLRQHDNVAAALRYDNAAYSSYSMIKNHIDSREIQFERYLYYFLVLITIADHVHEINRSIQVLLQSHDAVLLSGASTTIFNAMRITSIYATFFGIEVSKIPKYDEGSTEVDATLARARQAILANHVLGLHCLTEDTHQPSATVSQLLAPATHEPPEISSFSRICRHIAINRHPGLDINNGTHETISDTFQVIDQAASNHQVPPVNRLSCKFILIMLAAYDAFGPNILRCRLGTQYDIPSAPVTYTRAALDICSQPGRNLPSEYSPIFKLWWDLIKDIKAQSHRDWNTISKSHQPCFRHTSLVLLGYESYSASLPREIHALLQALQYPNNINISPLTLLLDIPALREEDHAVFLAALMSQQHGITRQMLDLDPLAMDVRQPNGPPPLAYSLNQESAFLRNRHEFLAPLLRAILNNEADESLKILYPHVPSLEHLTPTSLPPNRFYSSDQQRQLLRKTFKLLKTLKERYQALWKKGVWTRLLPVEDMDKYMESDNQIPAALIDDGIMQYLSGPDVSKMFNPAIPYEKDLQHIFESFPQITFMHIHLYMMEHSPTQLQEQEQNQVAMEELVAHDIAQEYDAVNTVIPPLQIPDDPPLQTQVNEIFGSDTDESSVQSPPYSPTSPIETLQMLTVIPNETQNTPNENDNNANDDENSDNDSIANDYTRTGYYEETHLNVNSVKEGALFRSELELDMIATTYNADDSTKKRRITASKTDTQDALLAERRNNSMAIGHGSPNLVPIRGLLDADACRILASSNKIYKSQSKGRRITVIGFYMHGCWIPLICIIKTRLRTGPTWEVNNTQAAKIAMFSRHKINRILDIPEDTIRNISAWTPDHPEHLNNHASGCRFIIANYNEVPLSYKITPNNNTSRNMSVARLIKDRFLEDFKYARRVRYQNGPSRHLREDIYCVIWGNPTIQATPATINLIRMSNTSKLMAAQTAYYEGMQLSPQNLNPDSPHILIHAVEVGRATSLESQLLTVSHNNLQASSIQLSVPPLSDTLTPMYVYLRGRGIDALCIAFLNPQLQKQHVGFKMNEVVLIPSADLSLVRDNNNYMVAFCENEISRLNNQDSQLRDHNDNNVFMPPVPDLFVQPQPPTECFSAVRGEYISRLQTTSSTEIRDLLRPIGPDLQRLHDRFATLAIACAAFIRPHRRRNLMPSNEGVLLIQLNAGTSWNANTVRSHLHNRFGERTPRVFNNVFTIVHAFDAETNTIAL